MRHQKLLFELLAVGLMLTDLAMIGLAVAVKRLIKIFREFLIEVREGTKNGT